MTAAVTGAFGIGCVIRIVGRNAVQSKRPVKKSKETVALVVRNLLAIGPVRLLRIKPMLSVHCHVGAPLDVLDQIRTLSLVRLGAWEQAVECGAATEIVLGIDVEEHRKGPMWTMIEMRVHAMDGKGRIGLHQCERVIESQMLVVEVA